MTTELEIRVIWPQAKESLEPSEAGRGEKQTPLKSLEGARSCQNLDFGLLSSGTVRK